MTINDKLLYLSAGILGLLAFATLVGLMLKARVTSPGGVATVANLNDRIRAWWWMVLILGIALAIGKTFTVVLYGALSYLALREFITLTPTKEADRLTLAVAFFVLIPLQYWLVETEWYGLFSIFIPVYAFLFLPALSCFSQDTEHFLERTAKIQWGIAVTVYAISHVPALLLLKIPGYDGQNMLLMVFLLTVCQLSDVMQYVFGKLFGKTKIAPVVSPSKTVEGFIGGGLAATAIGTGLWWITPFTPLQAAGFSALIVVMGFLGGLVLSAVKRSLGAKDWGSMIEGHGGVMDRLDSVSFAAPVFFHLVRYLFT